MRKYGSTMRSLLVASALVFTATPAFAGDEERALAAIAEAKGKIEAAAKLNPSPDLIARANASLRLAQEQLKSGKEQKAIASAMEAQAAADTVIGEGKQRAELDAQAQTNATINAQQQADAANARATAAEQAAASAAADAQAARMSASMAAATPATTTVTTETVKATPASTTVRKTAPKRKIVRKTTSAPRTAVAERTTTTVTTQK